MASTTDATANLTIPAHSHANRASLGRARVSCQGWPWPRPAPTNRAGPVSTPATRNVH